MVIPKNAWGANNCLSTHLQNHISCWDKEMRPAAWFGITGLLNVSLTSNGTPTHNSILITIYIKNVHQPSVYTDSMSRFLSHFDHSTAVSCRSSSSHQMPSIFSLFRSSAFLRVTPDFCCTHIPVFSFLIIYSVFIPASYTYFLPDH